jgi:flavin reductase (DIM6/NTAB) family NADH-FMN oxidoreductase RutF
MEKTFDLADLEAFERFYKVNFITRLCGIRNANLIGTTDENGISNLGIFNSVTHIGANPPYLGFIQRPLTVPRQTYDNLKRSGFFTINQVNNSFFKKAHQTSAKYEKGVSEFKACELTEQIVADFPVPFVQESVIKIGLSFEEEHLIKCNQNILVIGKIQKVIISEDLIEEDGNILLEKANTTGVSGLDTYFKISELGKMKFARP